MSCMSPHLSAVSDAARLTGRRWSRLYGMQVFLQIQHQFSHRFNVQTLALARRLSLASPAGLRRRYAPGVRFTKQGLQNTRSRPPGSRWAGQGHVYTPHLTPAGRGRPFDHGRPEVDVIRFTSPRGAAPPASSGPPAWASPPEALPRDA